MKRTKCEECSGKILHKKVEYTLYGVSLGYFSAQVCAKCKEVCYDEEVSREMTRIAKEKGIYDLTTKTKVGKVGDSLDIRLNKKMAEFMGIEKGMEATIHPVNRHKIEIMF